MVENEPEVPPWEQVAATTMKACLDAWCRDWRITDPEARQHLDLTVNIIIRRLVSSIDIEYGRELRAACAAFAMKEKQR